MRKGRSTREEMAAEWVAAWEEICRVAKRRSKPHPEAPGATAVYVMQAASGRCKVGVSDGLPQRILAVAWRVPKQERPVRLYRALLLCPSVAWKVEKAAHRRLRRFHLGGEWFGASPRTCFAAVVAAANELVAIGKN
jgi:hypothetical protein